MNYALFSIDVSVSNRGNRLIEYAIKSTLQLPDPFVKISMFKVPSNAEIDKINQMCKFVLLPGSTILATGKGQGEALSALRLIKIPVFCVAGCIWEPNFKLNTTVLKHIAEPIGVRDPITFAQCTTAGIKCDFIGCPTLYLDDLRKPSERVTVFGFHRKNLDWQVNFFIRAANNRRVAVQEQRHELASAKKVSGDMFTYDCPKIVMEKYSSADRVITGRLHGVLPAMAQKKPVTFFGESNDSRFSLLHELGITINPIGEDTSAFKEHSFNDYNSKIAALKNEYYKWCNKTIKAI